MLEFVESVLFLFGHLVLIRAESSIIVTVNLWHFEISSATGLAFWPRSIRQCCCSLIDLEFGTGNGMHKTSKHAKF